MLCFFFFQAEDGIRDVAVTGVQTCALPISGNDRHFRVEQIDQAAQNPALRLSAQSEQNEIVPRQERVYDLRNHRVFIRSEEHTSELQSRLHLVCRLLLEKKTYDMFHPPQIACFLTAVPCYL